MSHYGLLFLRAYSILTSTCGNKSNCVVLKGQQSGAISCRRLEFDLPVEDQTIGEQSIWISPFAIKIPIAALLSGRPLLWF